MPALRASLDAVVSRRTALAAAGGAGLLGLLAACAPSGGGASGTDKLTDALNVYSWPDYFSKDALSAFAKKTGVTPRITTYTDPATLYSKLNSAAGAGYDVVIPPSSWIKQLTDKGLLEKLDHEKLSHLSGLDPSLLDRDYDKGNAYSIPKDWGVLGVVYDPDAVGGEIRTWQDFFDAGERSGVSGRIRMTTAAEETVGPALWTQGKDWNSATDKEVAATLDLLLPFAKHVKKFAGFDPNDLASGAIVLAQANQAAARNAIKLNPKLKWAVPGPWSELWVDSYAIAKAAPDLGRAYQFIDYQLTPAVQVAETEYLGYPYALKGLEQKLPSDTADRDLIFGGKGLDFDKLTSFVVNPETFPAFQKVQDQVTAAAGG